MIQSIIHPNYDQMCLAIRERIHIHYDLKTYMTLNKQIRSISENQKSYTLSESTSRSYSLAHGVAGMRPEASPGPSTGNHNPIGVTAELVSGIFNSPRKLDYIESTSEAYLRAHGVAGMPVRPEASPGPSNQNPIGVTAELVSGVFSSPRKLDFDNTGVTAAAAPSPVFFPV
jgi:hypothetical protein